MSKSIIKLFPTLSSNNVIVRYLDSLGVAGDNPIGASILEFETVLQSTMQIMFEEAVPAEMMQMFSDQQWPELIFEFQPSLRILSSTVDLVQFRRQVEAGNQPELPHAGQINHWMVVRDQQGQLVKPLPEQQVMAIARLQERHNFDEVAALLWPQLDVESRHSNMTNMLLSWLQDGLIIDAGVPLPADAEFEPEYSEQKA